MATHTETLLNAELYIRSMGKLLRVSAYAEDTADGITDANRMMSRHPELAVVAQTDGLILMANKYDQGVKLSEAMADYFADQRQGMSEERRRVDA